MCSKTLYSSSSSPDLRTRPMRKTRKTTSLSTKPSRKTRARKHKSLKRDLALSQPYSPDSPEDNKNQKLKNLFPLHPENLHEVKIENENEIENDNVGVAYLFDADGGESLTEFLWDGRDGECPVSSCSDSLCLSPSLTWECGVSSFSLEKTALRHHKERDPSEEKWVCYSEVVEKKEMEEEEEELSCCVPEYWNTDDYDYQTVRGKLLLKLDYQQIINAWSDKGPLFVDGESPQVVPDILDHGTNGMMENGKVPMLRVGGGDGNSVKEGVDGGESWKVEHRKARVLRYKEKRQNRLFAKRIRYEVRKLNAEKRPRMKGRFVKRS